MEIVLLSLHNCCWCFTQKPSQWRCSAANKNNHSSCDVYLTNICIKACSVNLPLVNMHRLLQWLGPFEAALNEGWVKLLLISHDNRIPTDYSFWHIFIKLVTFNCKINWNVSVRNNDEIQHNELDYKSAYNSCVLRRWISVRMWTICAFGACKSSYALC